MNEHRCNFIANFCDNPSQKTPLQLSHSIYNIEKQISKTTDENFKNTLLKYHCAAYHQILNLYKDSKDTISMLKWSEKYLTFMQLHINKDKRIKNKHYTDRIKINLETTAKARFMSGMMRGLKNFITKSQNILESKHKYEFKQIMSNKNHLNTKTLEGKIKELLKDCKGNHEVARTLSEIYKNQAQSINNKIQSKGPTEKDIIDIATNIINMYKLQRGTILMDPKKCIYVDQKELAITDRVAITDNLFDCNLIILHARSSKICLMSHLDVTTHIRSLRDGTVGFIEKFQDETITATIISGNIYTQDELLQEYVDTAIDSKKYYNKGERRNANSTLLTINLIKMLLELEQNNKMQFIWNTYVSERRTTAISFNPKNGTLMEANFWLPDAKYANNVAFSHAVLTSKFNAYNNTAPLDLIATPDENGYDYYTLNEKQINFIKNINDAESKASSIYGQPTLATTIWKNHVANKIHICLATIPANQSLTSKLMLRHELRHELPHEQKSFSLETIVCHDNNIVLIELNNTYEIVFKNNTSGYCSTTQITETELTNSYGNAIIFPPPEKIEYFGSPTIINKNDKFATLIYNKIKHSYTPTKSFFRLTNITHKNDSDYYACAKILGLYELANKVKGKPKNKKIFHIAHPFSSDKTKKQVDELNNQIKFTS